MSEKQVKLIPRRKRFLKLTSIFCGFASLLMTVVLVVYRAYIFAVPFILSTGYWILVWHKLKGKEASEK